ncbi:MAG: hypothetical protein A2Y38_07275 [Spirochaetes bacterium GWB1_59_5]|nr:MAG: hypothetical protein A2Y38_07275 [Spirochaetes bacterium GWB1_59_5]
MTTAHQMIDYLTTLPPDTEIEVLEAYRSHYDTCTRWVPLDLNHPYSDSMDLIAFTNVAEGHPYRGKTILFLGVE